MLWEYQKYFLHQSECFDHDQLPTICKNTILFPDCNQHMYGINCFVSDIVSVLVWSSSNLLIMLCVCSYGPLNLILSTLFATFSFNFRVYIVQVLPFSAICRANSCLSCQICQHKAIIDVHLYVKHDLGKTTQKTCL